MDCRNHLMNDQRSENDKELICQLHNKRLHYCGMNMRNVKLMLNRLGKTDKVALAYRYMLEIEDFNIKAKETYGKYSYLNYEQKSKWIHKLITLCVESGFRFGIQASDVSVVSHVVYFDIDGCEQVSFHNSFTNPSDYPVYQGEWDGKINSTLDKIERAVLSRYRKEIDRKVMGIK